MSLVPAISHRKVRCFLRPLSLAVVFSLVLNPFFFNVSRAEAQEAASLFVNGKYYHNVKPIAEGLDLAQAKAITVNNNIDEIIFEGPDGRLYIAFGQSGAMGELGEVREGYLGSFRGEKVKVVSVNDESNTFAQGATSVPKGIGNMLSKVFKDNFTTTVTTILSTISGGVIAALALKSGVSAGAAAAASGATTAAAGSAGVAAAVTGATAAIKGALLACVTPVVVAVVGITVVMGAAMLVGGFRGLFGKPRFATIDMVTDQNFQDMQDYDGKWEYIDRLKNPDDANDADTKDTSDKPVTKDEGKIIRDEGTDM